MLSRLVGHGKSIEDEDVLAEFQSIKMAIKEERSDRVPISDVLRHRDKTKNLRRLILSCGSQFMQQFTYVFPLKNTHRHPSCPDANIQSNRGINAWGRSLLGTQGGRAVGIHVSTDPNIDPNRFLFSYSAPRVCGIRPANESADLCSQRDSISILRHRVHIAH